MVDQQGRGPARSDLQPSPDGEGHTQLDEIRQIRSSQDKLIQWAHILSLKYLRCPERTAGDSLSTWMDQFDLEDDYHPKDHLVNTLLPTLREETIRLPILLNPSKLAQNTLSKLKKVLDVFDTIDHTFEQILDTAPIVWDHRFVNRSDESEDFEFRSGRMEEDVDTLAIEIHMAFTKSENLLRLFNLSDHQPSDAAIDCLKQLTRWTTSCREHCDLIIEFLGQSLFNTFLDDWQIKSNWFGDSMRSFHVVDPSTQNDSHYDREKRNALCLPFFKLGGLFFDKISKPTNPEPGLFSRMTPRQLLAFHFRTNCLVDDFVTPMVISLNQRTDRQDFYNYLVKVIASFSQSLECIYDFLDDLSGALVSDVEQRTIQEIRCWYQLWNQQLLISLRNITKFVGCRFPKPEEWSRVEFPEF